MTVFERTPAPEIATLSSKGIFLHCKDRLTIDPKYRKILFDIFKYDVDPKVSVHHSVSLSTALYLINAVKQGLFVVGGKAPATPSGQSAPTLRGMMEALKTMPGFLDGKELTPAAFDFVKALGYTGKWKEFSEEQYSGVIQAVRQAQPLADAPPQPEAPAPLLPGHIRRFVEFKGGPSEKYPSGFEARILTIERQAANKGDGHVYVITIENGEGEPAGAKTGAVKMKARTAEKKSVTAVIEEQAFVGMLLEVEVYVSAWFSANLAEIRAAAIYRKDAD